MGHLMLLLFAVLVGLTLRLIVNGQFEMDQFLLILLCSLGAVGILLFEKNQIKRDRNFVPNHSGNQMVTRMSNRLVSSSKQIYDYNKFIGTYRRFYNSSWKRFVAGIMRRPGHWYLNLSFLFSDGEEYIFVGINENKLHGNQKWKVYRGDEEVGLVRTDLSIKNASKLKESLFLEYDHKTYWYRSFGIGSKTEVSVDENTVASGERARGFVYQFTPSHGTEHDAKMLCMVYILFNYQFGQ
ncbi:hypothetical protein CEY16_13050 [Halalkalibacillus sediminis]|uniref:Tubby C-terminal domain-containing protein n=1 Tax=Halalkalibacillus sediminis TaxID=2018042 RepID=A0A2I0QQY8_9BACI|nr:hypothetical protein [Halalkalibacillus sediminis]PKR76741.1 hypothetical protein CEY16_13050 [Halalkalibacillus sediminis]